MSRCIDADILIQDTIQEYTRSKQYRDAIIRMVNKAPTIETKRGEWAERTHNTLIAQVNFAYCSECGQPIMHEHTRPLWSFCPNCGADMRGKDDE